MKILIDVDALEQSGVLSPQLAAVLRTHAVRDTGSTAINILLAFGAIAIAAGILSLKPSAGFGAFFGLGFILLGWLITKQHAEQWGKLGNIWMIVGALVLVGGVGMIIDQPFVAPLCAALILVVVSVIAGSRLLIGLAPIALAAAIGGSTGYWHACYQITVKEPTLTIMLFTGLGYAAWLYAKDQKNALYQSLAITFARVCVILVNFGFWIGSLWGDYPGQIWQTTNHYDDPMAHIPDMVFVVGWLMALVVTGAWAAKHGRRFVVNTVAVFGAIHFYTQWFEMIGFQALSVIVAGVATVAFGLALWRYNRRQLSA